MHILSLQGNFYNLPPVPHNKKRKKFPMKTSVMDLKVEHMDIDYKQPPPLQVFAHTSTLHGISHIFSYDKITAKCCLWVVFFLSSLTFLLYVCIDRIQFYLEYPHVTKLDEISTPVMVFPAVTICNLNSIRFSRITRNDLYHAGELLALLNSRWVNADWRVCNRRRG